MLTGLANNTPLPVSSRRTPSSAWASRASACPSTRRPYRACREHRQAWRRSRARATFTSAPHRAARCLPECQPSPRRRTRGTKVAPRRAAKHAPVLSRELRWALLSDPIARASDVDVFDEDKAAGFVEAKLLLILER
jgi:hypothetical protein